MNEMNMFHSMGMMRTHDEECEDQKSEKYCKKMKKKNKCKSKKVAKVCKKSCQLCDNGQGEFSRVISSQDRRVYIFFNFILCNFLVQTSFQSRKV